MAPVLLSFLSLAALAAARDLTPPPKEMPEYLQESMLVRANATAETTGGGYNVSQKFPGSADDKSWQYTIRVSDNITNPENAGQKLGAVLWGVLPDESYRKGKVSDSSSVFKADDSWAFCVAGADFRRYSVPIIDEDGEPSGPIEEDCSGVLPKECIAWLDEYAKNGTLCQQGPDDKSPMEGSPCDTLGGSFGKDNLRAEKTVKLDGAPLNSSLGSYMLDPRGWSLPTTAYDDEVVHVTVVMAGWGPSDKLKNGRIEKGAKTVASKYVCLRPSEFSAGSRNFTTMDDESAAPRMAGGAIWTAVSSSAVAMVLAFVLV